LTLNSQTMVELVKVTKIYPPDIMALVDVSLVVKKGEMLFLTGVSGAGKSTLLKLVCMLETPDKGFIEVAGHDLHRIKPAALQKLRQQIGVAYQDFKLLPNQSVFQNVAMAMEVGYQNPKAIRNRVAFLLDQLGIANKRNIAAGHLSRGEQQRVAFARAAANSPALLLADEPTGNLDPGATRMVLNLMEQLNATGTTLIIATHDESIHRNTSQRVLNLEQGHFFSAEDDDPDIHPLAREIASAATPL